MYLTPTERIALALSLGDPSLLTFTDKPTQKEAEKQNLSYSKASSPYRRQVQIACAFERSMRGDCN